MYVIRLAQEPRRPVGPRQHAIGADVGTDPAVGVADFLAVPRPGWEAEFRVHAEQAEPEVETGLREVPHVAGRDDLRPGDPVCVGLLEADEVDLVGRDAALEDIQGTGSAPAASGHGTSVTRKPGTVGARPGQVKARKSGGALRRAWERIALSPVSLRFPGCSSTVVTPTFVDVTLDMAVLLTALGSAMRPSVHVAAARNPR